MAKVNPAFLLAHEISEELAIVELIVRYGLRHVALSGTALRAHITQELLDTSAACLALASFSRHGPCLGKVHLLLL